MKTTKNLDQCSL